MRSRLLGILLCSPLFIVANPSGPTVVHGQADFAANGNHLSINTSEKAIIEWENFSIQMGETTQFLQPHAQSAVLNRVISSNPSQLFGTLQSNGKVYLINQKGIIVGNSGVVQTGSFFASTLDVLNDDFIAGGDLAFQGISPAHLINEGKIEALDGDVILIGQFVQNSGELTALNGLCGIGCGEKVLLKEEGVERLFILTPIQTELDVEAGIQQEGVLKSLSTELKASGNPYALAVAHKGTIDALGVRKEGGNVFLVAENGNLYVSGEVTAENGTVHLHGDQVVLADGALIDVSAENGAGSVYIGKDPQFSTSPKAIFVEPDGQIHADARNSGNGGKVILWADEIASFNGVITAMGGPTSGDGGFVEVSSAKSVIPRGMIETSAPMGKKGTLLLDPCAVTITSVVSPITYTTPLCMAPFPLTSICIDFTGLMTCDIVNSDLVALLVANNVVIDASASGTLVTPGSITVLAGALVEWPAAVPTVGTPTSLTLIADGSITINDSIRANYTSAPPVGFTNAIELDAPTITIDGTTGNLQIISLSGGIDIQASTDLSLVGTAGTVQINTSTGNVTVNDPINRGNITTSGAEACILTSGGDLTAYFHDINLAGAGGGQIGASSTTLTTNTVVDATGHCHIIGGSNAITPPVSGIGSLYGPVELTVGQDIILTAGTSTGASAKIQAATLVGASGNLIIHSATDITLTGGTSPTMGAHALIGTGDLSTPLLGGGTVAINCSGNIIINGGDGDQCYAGVVTNGTSITNSIAITSSTPASTITITSNGLAAPTAFAGIETTNGGDISISGFRDLTMTGSSATNPALIRTGVMGGNLSITMSTPVMGTTTLNDFTDVRSQFLAGTLTFSGGNLSLISTAGPALMASDAGAANVSLAGSLVMQGGTDTSASIASAYASGTGNLTLTARDITMTGGSGTAPALFAFADISAGKLTGGGSGAVSVTATGPGGITMNGGTGDLGAAIFGTWAIGPDNHITINITDPSADLTMTATHLTASTASPAILINDGGNITINVARDIITTAASLTSPVIIQNAFSTMMPNDRDITLIAGRTINFGPFTQLESKDPLGSVFLVVDNNFPTPPQAGPGQFILDATASLTSGASGGLFIYTSNHLQNTFTAGSTLNGSPFLGANPLVDSPQEQWGVYHPDNPNAVTGIPYTVFYKEGYVVPLIVEIDFTIAFSEAFQLWRTYDRMVYVVKTIETKYEDPEKMRERMKPDALSSFDLPAWAYSYFYQAHRNYNTLKLDQRL